MGLLAAGMLLLTPIHFIRGRLLLSPLYSIPFILGWLWALARFEADRRRGWRWRRIWLGLGAYSYLAAVVMMPLYLAVTLAIGYRRLGLSAAVKAAAAFAATLIPMVLWYVTHPERNAQIVSAYQLDAQRRIAVDAMDRVVLVVLRSVVPVRVRRREPDQLHARGRALSDGVRDPAADRAVSAWCGRASRCRWRWRSGS